MQVFGEGPDAVKKSLEGIFDDTVPDGKVKINTCSFWSTLANAQCGGWGMLKSSTLSMKNRNDQVFKKVM